MKNLTIALTASLLASALVSCGPGARQGTSPYAPQPWPARVWASETPPDCPFERSKDIVAVAFTRNSVAYTDADTWYPSWAQDGNMYSGWTDGEIGEEGCHSNGRNARTGNARIEGADPLNLTVTSLGTEAASAEPYGGRYPSANLVHNGIWYYGTYAVDFDFTKPEYPDLYSWAICGPLPGFRISRDYGRTWTPSPLSPEKPLFPESGKGGRQVKMGTPHFVDFGRNMENSPDGKAYLVGHGALDGDPAPRIAGNSWIAGDAVYLARVTPSPETINDPASYEFYAGRGQDGRPVWSKDFAAIRPLASWNNRMGCTTIAYDAPLRKYLMCVTDGWPGVEDMNSYLLEADEITGPYRLIAFMEKFGRQGYFLNFPSKFIGADGRSAWLSYSANFHKKYFGNRTVADPMGGRYAWTLQEVRLLDAAGLAGLTEAASRAPEDRLKSEANIALRARVNVSSVHKKNKPFTELIEYFGEGAVDGVVDLDENVNRREWVSRGERQTAMIRLSWDSPQEVRRVWLFDRPNAKDHITSGALLFSDGSSVKVGELPNDARSAREIVFPAKRVSWVVFAADTVSPETSNAGLAEFAVFKD
ncbi:MAG TPA: hypothetical protein P5119_04480 [Candidatus Aminicenantes bacterium]|nr:hypothetical protein [Candidatus Aminicenantes bacterium]HRY64581.1 hypothetical protein [Candidatus Aminicenantes bacterium]HRZ71494.1 hypothetical protein [Candidatus Aminicenantes bacterium]